MTSIYEECSAEYDSATTEFVKCISDGHEENFSSLASGVDTFYLIFAGALVYFMQTGFAMLCAGSIRTKNVMNVLLWNLLDSCGGAIGFWSFGYAFAYGGDDMGGKTFIGHTNFFLSNGADMEQWFFQFAFACALSSIVAGTVAERSKMQAYLCYSVFLTGFVYPVVAHAFWSTNGWLANSGTNPLWGSGAIDLAGSGPVHMTGGVAALVMALVLGPRKGRFHDADGNLLDEPREFPPHSVALQFLGTFCLWFGWYGFNPGSTLRISSTTLGDVASLVAVNTSLSAAAGAVSAMFTKSIRETWKTGVTTYDLTAAMNGCLSGLVAVTAPCATVEPWAGFVIGVVAGWLYLLGSHLLVKFRIDDAVDAIPVHMVGGAWGVISTGLFTNESRLEAAFGTTENIGWFYEWGRGSGNFTLLGIQIIAVLFIIGWVFAIMGPFFLMLNYFDWLRVDPLEEEVGLDISRHKGSAYQYEDGTAKIEDIENLAERRSVHGGSRSGSFRSGGNTQVKNINDDKEPEGNEAGA